MIVAPGGSNIMLMYGAEGMEIAERFKRLGIHRLRAYVSLVA